MAIRRLRRIAETSKRTVLLASDGCKVLAEYLGGYDQAFFFSAGKYSDPASLAEILGSLGPACHFYNFGLNRAVCSELGKLASRGVSVSGISLQNGAFVRNAFARDEMDYWRDGKLPPGGPGALAGRRDRILGIMDLPPYKGEFLPFGVFKEKRGFLPDSKLIAFEPKAGWPSRSYPHAEEFKETLRKRGYEFFVPSEELLPMGALFEKLKSAAAIAAADTFVSNIGIYAGIPTLALCGATDPAEVGFEDWIFAKPPCAPCGAARCERPGLAPSCLSALAPDDVFNALSALLKAGKRGTVKRVLPAAVPEPALAGKKVNVFSADDFRNALRFAAPAAAAFAGRGAEVFLHVPEAAAGVAGFVCGNRVQIVAAPSGWAASFPGGLDEAAANYAKALPPADYSVFLNCGGLDASLSKIFKKSSWHSVSSEAFGRFEGPSAAWESLYENEKTLTRLFGILGISGGEILEKKLRAPRDIDTSSERLKIALDCSSCGIPALSCGQGDKIEELLAADFEVFRADKALSSGINALVQGLASCSAALSVNSLILDIAVALRIPSLLLEGPLWESPSSAPFALREARFGAFPAAKRNIDFKGNLFLSSVPPELIASEFKSFVFASDRTRWRNS